MKDPPDHSWLHQPTMSELELEAYRIEVEEKRIKAEVEKRRLEARERNGMSGREKMHTSIGITSAIAAAAAIALMATGMSACEIQSDQQDTKQITACVSNGGQWVENPRQDYECQRK